MIDIELLQALQERIGGSVLDGECLLFGTCEICASSFPIEFPYTAFWMLGKMEEAGFTPQVHRFESWFLSDIMSPFDFRVGKGDTRTEAIARLFIQIMPKVTP